MRISNFIKKYPYLFLLFVGLLIYLPSLLNGFVWDDEEQVLGNVAIRSVANIPSFFSQSTFNNGGAGKMSGMYFKPLMPVSFALIHIFSGLNAWGYHLFQTVLHLANTGLVYSIFLTFFSPLAAFLGALLFLVHPANVETVVYISALQDALYMFFGLLSLKLLVKNKEINFQTMLYVGGLMFLALLGKETGVLFLGINLLYVLLYRRESLVDYLMTMALVVAGYFLLRFGMAGIGLSQNHLSPIMKTSVMERWQNIPAVVLFYLEKLILPAKLAISQHWLVQGRTFGDFFMPLAVIFTVVLLFVAGLYQSKKSGQKWPTIFFFGGVLFSALFLHSQIVALDMTVAERWMYVMVFGAVGIFLYYLDQGLKQEKLKPVLVWGLSIVILTFTLRSAWRVSDWRTGLKLYEKDEATAKDTFDFENNFGVYLFRVGRYKESKKHYLRSTIVEPLWWTNWNNLGVIYEMEGKVKQAEKCYLRSIKNGDYYLAYENYTKLLLKQKKWQQAKTFLEKEALVRFPYNGNLRNMYSYIIQNSKGKSQN